MSRDVRDAAYTERLMRDLAEVPASERTARFVCVMRLAVPADGIAKVIAESRGEFVGRIGLAGEVPRGVNGFGYDPLFVVAPDFVQTGAELDPSVKNTISHRAKAAAALVQQIAQMKR